MPCFGEPSEGTVAVLAAMVTALLSEMLNGDLVLLSIDKAKRACREAGVPDAEFERVAGILAEYWARKKAANPLGSMF